MKLTRRYLPQAATWAVVGMCAFFSLAVLWILQNAATQGSGALRNLPWLVGALLALHLGIIVGLAFLVQHHVRLSSAATQRLQGEVTERESTVSFLRESEQRLRAFLDHANDSIFVINPARDKIVDVNPAACKMLGYTREEFLALSVSDVHPGEMEKMEAFAKTVMEQGHGETDQLGCMTKSGNYLAAEISASYFTDVGGEQHMVCIVRDITERKRTEEAQKRLLSILEETPDVVVTTDPDGKLQYINRAGRELLGLQEEDAIENIRISNCHPDWVMDRMTEEALPAAIRDGVWRGETALLDSDLKEVPASQVLVAHKNGEGEVEYLSSILRDISEQKRSEEALQLTQFSVDKAAVPVFWVGSEGQLHYVNEKACAVLGYTQEELLSMSVFDISPDTPREKWPEQWAKNKKQGSLTFETRHLRKNGEAIPVEIAANYLSVDGKEYNCAFGFDLRERRRIERALEERQIYLNALIEHSPLAIVVLDAKNRVELCNPAFEELFGYTRDELHGQDLNKFIASPELSAEAVKLSAQVNEGGSVNICTQRRRKDGSLVDVEIHGVPLWIQWELAGTYGIYQDVTERKKAEQAVIRKAIELERSNKELEQFAYVASHDLQEPLRMVASYTQLLARRYQGNFDEDADEFIEYVLGGVKRMQGLINDLLLYSRVGTRGKPLRKTKCQEVFDNAMSNLQMTIGETGAVITRDSLPVVKADPIQLAQLFQNLVGNALKFRGEDTPRIHLGVERNGQCWVFNVSDNGIGMEPQFLEKIFVMFQRLHNRKDYEGTGIGLAVCKKIIERHEGRIWAESKPGEGTQMFFTLPIA